MYKSIAIIGSLSFLTVAISPAIAESSKLVPKTATQRKNEAKCQANNGAACFERARDAATANKTFLAVPYLQKACELNHPESCVHLGDMAGQLDYGFMANFKQARSFYQKACDLGHGGGCAGVVGSIIDHDDDQNDVVAYAIRACEARIKPNSTSCSSAAYRFVSGFKYNGPLSREKAKKYYLRARALAVAAKNTYEVEQIDMSLAELAKKPDSDFERK
jgi:TPR repeat protein